jgi:hypothetical protein
VEKGLECNERSSKSFLNISVKMPQKYLLVRYPWAVSYIYCLFYLEEALGRLGKGKESPSRLL